jgi:repressor LexA
MEEIIEAVDGYFFTHKETPSITEIARIVGRSRSTVHAYLQEMNKIGRIRYDGATLETPVTSKADSGYTLSPIVGSIACGEPQYEEENFEAYVALPDALFGTGEHFILKAKGESMIEAGIDPGDLVVVRKQNIADEGDIIVALVDNETTLKRFYRDEEHQCIRLHPENRSMEDILVKNCYIQGVAQHVIKAL